jgi:hypothetical protein
LRRRRFSAAGLIVNQHAAASDFTQFALYRIHIFTVVQRNHGRQLRTVV